MKRQMSPGFSLTHCKPSTLGTHLLCRFCSGHRQRRLVSPQRVKTEKTLDEFGSRTRDKTHPVPLTARLRDTASRQRRPDRGQQMAEESYYMTAGEPC